MELLIKTTESLFSDVGNKWHFHQKRLQVKNKIRIQLRIIVDLVFVQKDTSLLLTCYQTIMIYVPNRIRDFVV